MHTICRKDSSVEWKTMIKLKGVPGVCDLQVMDGESSESRSNRFGVSSNGERMKCGKVEGIKHRILRWFGYKERMAQREMNNRVH